jgi:peptide/nickel transport system permease protein
LNEIENTWRPRNYWGAGAFIMAREILPNVMGPVVVEATVRLGYAIFTAATLSFLGLGVQQPSPDWGSLSRWDEASFKSRPGSSCSRH